MCCSLYASRKPAAGIAYSRRGAADERDGLVAVKRDPEEEHEREEMAEVQRGGGGVYTGVEAEFTAREQGGEEGAVTGYLVDEAAGFEEGEEVARLLFARGGEVEGAAGDWGRERFAGVETLGADVRRFPPEGCEKRT